MQTHALSCVPDRLHVGDKALVGEDEGVRGAGDDYVQRLAARLCRELRPRGLSSPPGFEVVYAHREDAHRRCEDLAILQGFRRRSPSHDPLRVGMAVVSGRQ